MYLLVWSAVLGTVAWTLARNRTAAWKPLAAWISGALALFIAAAVLWWTPVDWDDPDDLGWLGHNGRAATAAASIALSAAWASALHRRTVTIAAAITLPLLAWYWTWAWTSL